MSRSIIWGIVAIVVLALTGTAYVVASSSQEKRIKKDLRERVEAARDQLRQSASIQGLVVRDKVERLAANPRLLTAVKAPNYDDLKREAGLAWSEFLVDNKEASQVDLALVDANGNVVYVNAPPGQAEPPFPTAGQFKDPAGKITVPALAQALTRRIVISELGALPNASLSRIVTAPIIDFEASAKNAAAGVARDEIVGAVVVSFPITHDEATSQDALLRVRVGYFDPAAVATTSFKRADNKENTNMRGQLEKALDAAKLRTATFDDANAPASALTTLDVGGTEYMAATVRLARLPTKDVVRLNKQECGVAVDYAIQLAKADPAAAAVATEMAGNRDRQVLECAEKATWDDWRCELESKTFADLGKCPMPGTSKWTYPRQDAGAIVLIAVGSEAAAFTKPAKTFILLLGLGALVVAMFGMYLTHRRIESQIDTVESGVTEIINGNLDRTFQPVGKELDGLANGLNVMLARLLGRPEPGEEAFDENGNPIIPGRVDFEEAPEGPAPAQSPETDLEALAREPEPDYYKRLFTEYGAARRDTGSPDDVSFESFIAKLRVNEGKLKAQYQCRAVRFRVVVKDGKVSLKPVPIF